MIDWVADKPWELAWSEFQLGRARWNSGARDAGRTLIVRARDRLRLEPGPDPWPAQVIDRFAQQNL